jgi:hypothetical protein
MQRIEPGSKRFGRTFYLGRAMPSFAHYRAFLSTSPNRCIPTYVRKKGAFLVKLDREPR